MPGLSSEFASYSAGSLSGDPAGTEKKFRFPSPQGLASRTLRCIAPMVCNNPLTSHPVFTITDYREFGGEIAIWIVLRVGFIQRRVRDARPCGDGKIFFHYMPGGQYYPSAYIFSFCKKLIYLELIVAFLLQNA
ncbi:hypothetical protein [Mucilaginibacter sp. OK098]|uniref:hypothetical protein n=1 Tax=Mucilaginibacter sp. OK098 TaxID=1855297 RepID=UPI00116139D4|nr:hypothetical protein [Mucilaginibacter sp. OK098]